VYYIVGSHFHQVELTHDLVDVHNLENPAALVAFEKIVNQMVFIS